MNLLGPLVLSSVKSGFRLIVTVPLAVGVLCSGCTTLRSVPLPAPGQPGPAATVKVGDEVQVQLKSGEKLAFKITEIAPDALVGRDVRVQFQDMTSLQVKQFAPALTGLAVIGGAAGFVVILVLAIWAGGGMAFMPGGP